MCVCVCVLGRTWTGSPKTIETSSVKRLAGFELAVGDKSLHLKATDGRISFGAP